MARLKRLLPICVIALGLGLVMRSVWPSPAFVSSIRLPKGVSLAQVLAADKGKPPGGWHTNIYCRGDMPRPSGRSPSYFMEAIRYRVHEALGRTLCRVPNPPRCDFVTPRLGECFQISGEKYLLAKEFGWEVSPPPGPESDWTFLCFVWGDTNQLRHAREVVALTEEGILKSGIFGMRMKWSLPQQQGVMTKEYLPTNQCAVIRDLKGLVKIVPIEHLKAYVDAGLVTLPPGK